MKNLLYALCMFMSLYCVGQTTHSATVHVNQPAVCTVVSTEKNLFEDPVLYPNPATKTIFIKNLEANTQVEILDALGRNVFRNFFESEHTISIDVEPFTRGIYHVIMRNQRRYIQVKALVE